jgi:hypothetical protein
MLKQVCTVLLSDQNGDFSLEHSWDPGGLILSSKQLQELEDIMSHTTSVPIDIPGQQSIACQIHYTTLVVENMLDALYSSWYLQCGKLDIGDTQRFEFRPEKLNFVRISPISVGSGK